MSPTCYTPLSLAEYFLSKTTMDPECLWTLAMRPAPYDVSITQYFLVFLITCLLEAPFYILAFRKSGRNLATIFLAVLILNSLTHPFIFFLVPKLVIALEGKMAHSLLISEVFAPVIESIALMWMVPMPFGRALLYALAANLFSWWLGLYLMSYLVFT